MKWLSGCALLVSLIMPMTAKSAVPDATGLTAPIQNRSASMELAKADDEKGDSKVSETDKRAKAADCSKQADAKKLHGEARKKFRSACKNGK